MNAPTTAIAERQLTPVAEARMQLEQLEGQFKAALPAHIPVERFARVVMTAIQNNPGLLDCTRRSLWNAAMKAAQDGLLPDGREGAMVKYGNDAQWMPMIAGLRKKVRNSGEIATWDAQVVHEKDNFKFQLGDEPFIHHEPCLEGDPGKVIAAYSIAVLKGGEKSREVMSIAQIEKVRSRSKAAKNGPWVTDYEEMCRKTVARRHSKTLPMSTDLDDLMRRDDDLYDLSGARDEAAAQNGGRPQTLAGKLDVLAKMPSSTIDSPQQASPPEQPAAADQAAPETPQEGVAEDSARAEPGAAEVHWPEGKIPQNEIEYADYCRRGWFLKVGATISADDAGEVWKKERALRNRAMVTEDIRDGLKSELDAILAQKKAA